MDRAEAITYWEGLHKTFSSQLEKEENHFRKMHLQYTLDVLDTTIAALREQELESNRRQLKVSEWISDRLPTEEENEGVIIGIVNGNNGRITFTDAEIFVRYDFEEKAWWSVDYDIEGCEVKCWYALPEPPKEGADHE